MVEKDTNKPYVLEVNSAPGMTPNEDGSPCYNLRCLGDSLAWHMEREDYEHLSTGDVNNWRDVIHPAQWRNHPENEREAVFTTTRVQ